VCVCPSISEASCNNLSVLVVSWPDVENVKADGGCSTSTSNGPHASLVGSNRFKGFVSNATVGAVWNAVAAGEQGSVASNWGDGSQFWVVLKNVVWKWFFLMVPRDNGGWTEMADGKSETKSCKNLHDWKLMRFFYAKMVYFGSEKRALLAVKWLC